MRVIAFLFLLLNYTIVDAQSMPNVIIVYADDLGYGDLSCYGASKIQTPHIDALAKRGVKFTNAHSTSATCTPSRYAMITGKYPWKNKQTEILPGDAPLIIPVGQINLASMFKASGYATAVVGKWHLGLGAGTEKNWNAKIQPGPNEIGFDYSFIFPATADRVPTVFMENGTVVGLDTLDPIQVNYQQKIGNEPTGKEHPSLLKMQNSPNHGHDNTIVNGVGRIGFMTGGKMARWTDEEVPLSFLEKSKAFVSDNASKPFFLFYSLTEPHVPRVPSTMFKGKSGLGPRGDAILQIDWAVGELVAHLKKLGIYENTLIIFSSDNGPVLDDGYQDQAVEKLNGHTPWGALRGGKYSSYEAGTRVPTLVSWPNRLKSGLVSDALLCQMDLLRSLGALIGYRFHDANAFDSQLQLNAWLGLDQHGRTFLIEQGRVPNAIIKGEWKFIQATKGPAVNKLTNIELANSEEDQLYNLKTDIGEKNNLRLKQPEIIKQLAELLRKETALSVYSR